MQGDKEAVYTSRRTLKSFWNEYSIYEDRIELEFNICFRKIVVCWDELESFQIYSPPVFKTSLCALKLDFADLYQHVGVRRANGIFKQLRFTPLDPEEFVSRIAIHYPSAS